MVRRRIRERKSRSDGCACAAVIRLKPDSTKARARTNRIAERLNFIEPNVVPIMRLSALRSLARRGASRARGLARRPWLKAVAVSIAVVAVLMVTVWTARYGWAIYRLNRGVGDTVFLDGSGREWFRLDEQRRDVPFSRISVHLKDAVIEVEDHRYYLHPGIDPSGLGRAAVTKIGRAHV